MDRMFSDRIGTGERTAPAARVVHRGKMVGLVECNLENGEGKLVAHATSTCQGLRGEAARGR